LRRDDRHVLLEPGVGRHYNQVFRDKIRCIINLGGIVVDFLLDLMLFLIRIEGWVVFVVILYGGIALVKTLEKSAPGEDEE
jgi:hypothetical protein